MGIIAYGQTDIGKVRKSNQDSIYLDPHCPLYIVADGMGGHQGGDIASQLAVNTIPQYFNKHLSQLSPEKNLESSVLYGNQAIFEKSQSNPQLKGMGTTIVMLYFHADQCYVANIGDSRAYLVHQKMIYQLSRDHSLIQEKINLGIYTRERAVMDQMKNVLVRTVGYEPNVKVDIFTYKVCKHDLFLICSDGLHGKVSDGDLLYIINKNLPDLNQAGQDEIDKTVQQLVQQANNNGGGDNISAILALAN